MTDSINDKPRFIIFDEINEKRRSHVRSGNTRNNDDMLKTKQLARAAITRLGEYCVGESEGGRSSGWFPKRGKSSREMLIQAAALIVAEIERVDRGNE